VRSTLQQVAVRPISAVNQTRSLAPMAILASQLACLVVGAGIPSMAQNGQLRLEMDGSNPWKA